MRCTVNPDKKVLKKKKKKQKRKEKKRKKENLGHLTNQ